jgi:DNA-binding transcriptional ArsR family regulator
MDDDLRNGLWNVCYDILFEDFLGEYFRPAKNEVVSHLWRHFFKLRVDDMPHSGQLVVAFLKKSFFTAPWNWVYDFVEVLARIRGHNQFPARCNYILQREMSGYRFSDTTLVPITDADELEAIREATGLPSLLQPVRVHILSAVALFSDKAPDYRNSIKESISAVEAMCKILTGEDKTTLGQALKRLEDKGIELHGALKQAFSNLYGYTNDADGIRHALLEQSSLDFDDAKFMLVSCSSFVNYLAAKARRVGAVPLGS